MRLWKCRKDCASCRKDCGDRRETGPERSYNRMTETVPEHRVIPKLLPRLCAFAETAWTQSDRRTWFNYTCRRETLTACGWFDLKV